MNEELIVIGAAWLILIAVPVVPFLIWAIWAFENGKAWVDSIWIDVIGWSFVAWCVYRTWNIEEVFQNYGK